MATPYTVYHPMGAGQAIAGGVGVSAGQQRRALDAAGVDWTDDRSDPHDLVHLNFLGPVALTELLRARRAGTPVVVHAHSLGDNVADTYRFSNTLAPLIARYYTWVYRQADTVVAVSEDTRRRLADRGVTGHVPVVSNGVDTQALEGVDDRDPGGPPGPTVVNLAQVYEVKGVPEFVEVGRRLPDVAFRWFGHRHRWLAPRSTKRTVAAAPANVAFPGYLPDKRDAFAMADVFLFPSRRETQGLSLLEAAYCGLPIVTRDLPVFDYLEDGVHCLKGEGPAEFAELVRTLLDDPDRRARLGANARDLAQEHTLEAVGASLRSVYETVLDQARNV